MRVIAQAVSEYSCFDLLKRRNQEISSLSLDHKMSNQGLKEPGSEKFFRLPTYRYIKAFKVSDCLKENPFVSCDGVDYFYFLLKNHIWQIMLLMDQMS